MVCGSIYDYEHVSSQMDPNRMKSRNNVTPGSANQKPPEPEVPELFILERKRISYVSAQVRSVGIVHPISQPIQSHRAAATSCFCTDCDPAKVVRDVSLAAPDVDTQTQKEILTRRPSQSS